MQTRSLETLLTIARSGSFAMAAKQLNMTLSAVSMQMKALEAELGAALFDRSHRPPKLTPLGRSVRAHADKLLAAQADMVAACQQESGALTGTFRIGFVATASVRLLPDFLVCARKHAPEARFDIETGLSEALEARVLSGQIDAAVVTASPITQSGLDYRLLRCEQFVYAVPQDFSGSSVSELFARLTFLHFLPQSGIGKLITEHVRPFVRAGKGSIYLDSVEAIMECVNKSIGFTLLPEPDVQRHGGSASALDSPQFSRELVLATASRGTFDGQAERLGLLFAEV